MAATASTITDGLESMGDAAAHGEVVDRLAVRAEELLIEAMLPKGRQRRQRCPVQDEGRRTGDARREAPAPLFLDELPQLFNVIRGDMSLVGPRPPLPTEVERYGFDMHRRFLVKPGLTGLWQVSGRSDLSWDDSVRIDVRYVENWSLTFDFMILWKTVGAVLRGSGAY